MNAFYFVSRFARVRRVLEVRAEKTGVDGAKRPRRSPETSYQTVSEAQTDIMRTQSPDTHLQAERVQIELLREAGTARRLALTFSLTQTALELSREGIRQQYPALSERERQVKFVALCYGEDLARRLHTDLMHRDP